MKKTIAWLLLAGVAALAFAGCGQAEPPSIPEDQLATIVVQTVAAEQTRIASLATPTPFPSPTPEPPTAEPTVMPPADPTATPQLLEPTPTLSLPTVTPFPSPTPLVGVVATATPSGTGSVCDRAQLVDELSVLPGSSFTPGSTFTKSWRIKNTGVCTWTRDYDLVFTGGDSLGGSSAIALKRDVRPGETVDISIDLKAPARVGDYQGTWMLSNSAGDRFGVGTAGSQALGIRIRVSDLSRLVYDFTANFCEGNWRNDNIGLSCPGTDGDPEGYVLRDSNPTLENGRTEDEDGLIVHPRAAANGLIRGRFPEISVREGDHFRAIIGCVDGQTNCNVRFQLRYRLPGQDVVTLQEWNEKFDGKVTSVDIDLTSLAGQKVSFVLTVRAKSDPNGDRAIWLAPRIVR